MPKGVVVLLIVLGISGFATPVLMELAESDYSKCPKQRRNEVLANVNNPITCECNP